MLPWQYRLYFWGVHGIFGEIVFTGLWEFAVTGKWQLMGVSSIWSFLTYGLGTFLLAELVRDWLVARHVPLLVRCLLYVLLAYAWEFSVGALLSYFDACPWDYTAFDYDVMGLITLEYAPGWFFAGMVFEYIANRMSCLEEVPPWRQKTT